MKLYLITGMSGSGKSSVVREMPQRGYGMIDIDDSGICHWEHIDTGEHAEYQSGMDQAWLEQHKWVMDIEQLDAIAHALDAEEIFVCGMAHNIRDYLDRFEKVFLLESPREVIYERLKNRDEEGAFGKSMDEIRAIFDEQQDFTDSLLQAGAIPIASNHPLAEVADEIESHLD
jgi:dephospho-CoA kinase